MENVTVLAVNDVLTLSAIILMTGMIFSKISKIVKLPDVVLYLIAGIIIGPSVLNLASIDSYPIANHLILTFGSAYILYDGGREIKLKILNNVKITVGLLATIGVAISAFSIGLISMKIFNISFIYALLIGSVIASTDPATLVPVFKEITIKDKLKQTVISESAFNDAAGAILVFSILTIIQSGKISLTHNLEELVVMILGGVFVGVLVGMLFSISISEGKLGLFHEFAPLVSIVGVILAYILAEKIHGSGYMATFVTGLVCGNKKTFNLWVPSKDFEIQTHVRETLAIIMRIAIFVLLGTHVDFISLAKYWKEAFLVVLALILIVRPVSVLICTLLDRKTKWKFNEILFMMWVRETGVIPAALSGMIMSMNIDNKGILSSVVFMAILITLGVQASTTKIVAKKLNVLEYDKK
ncbi:cation:proton antiporter [Tepidibacter formicigenes]|jgi:NhaP-type Na+/H+ or K+/H+ antiporter|uniref:Sodium/hydrogen exchanger family protein n=1 Tax=Tepidibacter formicigenes DSM 15518 TaxID=1123349 RepID=A0A1M6RQ08_9FIRM|nr:cation:proton antiporter [Tepidibacter formicigenes]SHK34572.1 Sodium/hydrogen exchanger family protein [Tepidibacter formicigenes DSM 15518]